LAEAVLAYVLNIVALCIGKYVAELVIGSLR